MQEGVALPGPARQSGYSGCVDPQALELANQTLAAAIDSLMSKGSPIAPLVYVAKEGRHEPRRVAAARAEDPAAVAKQMASDQEGADATAYAVDGVISYNGASSKGIIVEAWNFRVQRGARIGLRYELKGLRKRPTLIGSPLHLGSNGWHDPEDAEHDDVPAFPEVTGAGPAAEPPALPRVFSAAPAEPRPLPQWDPPVPPAPVGAEPVRLEPVKPEPVEPEPVKPEPVGLEPVEPAPAQPAPAQPDFGPPPTTAPVLGFDPPASAVPVPPPLAAPPVAPAPVPPPVPRPVIVDTTAATAAPITAPTAAHPADVTAGPAAVPSYTPVPIQRSETPLGNRAMFAGIMELATKGRSFPAFAIVQRGGAWEQVTMTDASLADAAASVRAYASTRTDAEFIAFAIDATVPVGDTAVPAVVVEVWEYATRVSFSVAQRYVPTGDPPSPRLSGRPLMRTQAGWVDVPSSMMLGGQVQFGYRDPDSA